MKKSIVIPLQIVNIDNDGVHLHVKISINGKSANMVLDTGASRTVFDKNGIKKFVKDSKAKAHEKLSAGLGTTTMKSHTIKIKKLKLGEIAIKDYQSVLLDLSHVNKSYGQIGLKPVDGVLGGDLLFTYKASILYDKKQLVLKSNNT
jgi:hypothetical protein